MELGISAHREIRDYCTFRTVTTVTFTTPALLNDSKTSCFQIVIQCSENDDHWAVVMDNVFCGTNDGPRRHFHEFDASRLQNIKCLMPPLMRQKNTLTLSAADSLSIKKSIKVNKKGSDFMLFLRLSLKKFNLYVA